MAREGPASRNGTGIFNIDRFDGEIELMSEDQREITRAELLATLAEALDGRRCVQAWLGVAEVLFAGFGEHVIPPPRAREDHPLPEYELQTEYSDWTLRGEMDGGTAPSSGYSARQRAAGMVGARVASWGMGASTLTLDIVFADGRRLSIVPYADAAANGRDPWQLRLPDGRHISVRADGSAYETPPAPPMTPKEKKVLDELVRRLRPRFGPKSR